MTFAEPGDPGTIAFRRSEFRGEQYNFCSEGCKWIFEREPEKYCQAWLPPHQIFQGHCGGATIPEVLAWYGLEEGVDNGEYLTSPDKRSWDEWHAPELVQGGV
jgi:phenol hydroxylase P3 protein